MIDEFVGQQQGRLELLLGEDAEDPTYLAAYFGGYATGYIGEQVAVIIFTAGGAAAVKVGLVGKGLRKGKQMATDLIAKAKTIAPDGDTIQKVSKGISISFGRTARSADEIRASRRNGSLCRSESGCFAEGTLILMADGSVRPIETLHAGHRVLGDDPNDDLPPESVLVKTQIITENETLYEILWDRNRDGIADGSVRATEEHPFWVQGHGWQGAAEVTVGARLINNDGGVSVVTQVKRFDGDFRTYNIDVDKFDTFYVWSGDSAVLVHNAEGEVSLYGDKPQPSGKVGSSHSVLRGRVETNRQHHLFFDAWIKAHYPNAPLANPHNMQNAAFLFQGQRTKFPCVELKYDHHEAGHDAGDRWLANHFNQPGLTDATMGDKWRQLDTEKMIELSEEILRGAKAAGANVDVDKISKLMRNRSSAWLYKVSQGLCP